MNCNNFNGKQQWTLLGPKLSGQLGDPTYRVPDYRGTTVIRCNGLRLLDSPSKRNHVGFYTTTILDGCGIQVST
jgi:hypothetical protein